MFRTRVLVTGLSGLIGGALHNHLGHDYELRALNRRRVDGVTCFQADVADLEVIQPAFDGVDTVVHLAAVTSMGAAPEAILQTNVHGTYAVFEAARRAGVRRVVFASSGAVVRGVPPRCMASARRGARRSRASTPMSTDCPCCACVSERSPRRTDRRARGSSRCGAASAMSAT